MSERPQCPNDGKALDLVWKCGCGYWIHAFDHETDGALAAASRPAPMELSERTMVCSALEHAIEWMSEDGCDCGTDEPGTCGLCEARAALAVLNREEGK